jgi:hypothetical protein
VWCVRMHESLRTHSLPSLIPQYVDGGNLSGLLADADVALSDALRLDWLRQV